MKTDRIELDSMPMRTNDGRDELNLVEFPLCALAHRLRPDLKTLHFEDQIWDERRGELVNRQLTVTGSDAYGLPTALDDEVLLGLIQLTKLRGFANRKVPFTRYQLLRLLGWRDETKNYERLEASLNRWTGVTLYYRNAWWNKSRGCWVDEKFHVLDNVRLCHRRDRQRSMNDGLSAFVWNDVLFNSFNAGNLKSIDFDFFKALKGVVAKRLYRFLDKRFFHRNRWEFDLKEFAWEHIGLARSYDASSLKRRLRAGVTELEAKGFLMPMPDTERFRKIGCAEWRVVFAKAVRTSKARPCPAKPTGNNDLAQALNERGVIPRIAEETVRKFPAARIKTQIEVFDWLRAKADARVQRNPPGFLVSAIREEYAPPREFASSSEVAKREPATAERDRQMQDRQCQREALRQTNEHECEQAVDKFWESLSAEEKTQVEAAAWADASPFQHSLARKGGSLATAVRRVVMAAYIRRRLQPSHAAAQC